jgi:hypothetical protein
VAQSADKVSRPSHVGGLIRREVIEPLLKHNGERIFCAIDYYDPTLAKGSEDPSKPETNAHGFNDHAGSVGVLSMIRSNEQALRPGQDEISLEETERIAIWLLEYESEPLNERGRLLAAHS